MVYMSDNSQQQTDWKERDFGALWHRQGRTQKYLSGHVRMKDESGKVTEQKVIVFTNKHKSADNQPDFRVYQADGPESQQKSESILDEVTETDEVLVGEAAENSDSEVL